MDNFSENEYLKNKSKTMISTLAKKLLLWFRRYQVSPSDYGERVGNITKGEFKTVLEELTDAESAGTVPTSIASSTNSFSIFLGEKYTLSTYILPEVADQEYTIVISNPAIASIIKNGTTVDGDNKWAITGHQVGTTNITFKATAKQTITKVVAVTVVALAS